MKGSPFAEAAIVLLVAVLCFFPMRQLTRSVSLPQDPASTHSHGHDHNHDHGFSETHVESAWLEIRSSHPPELLEVRQHGNLLWEGEGELNQDAEFDLRISEGRSQLDFVFRWPEKLEQAYMELRLEAGEFPMRAWGLWSSGEDERTWHLEWEEPL